MPIFSPEARFFWATEHVTKSGAKNFPKNFSGKARKVFRTGLSKKIVRMRVVGLDASENIKIYWK